jgi:hypothetical protein
MSTTNTSMGSPSSQPTRTTGTAKNATIKNAVIGALSVALVAIGGYMIYDKNRSSETITQKETQIATLTNEKSDVQVSFDASLARLDSMSSINSGLQGQLAEKNEEIAKVKNEIRSILNKKNATAAELGRAKKLINNLNEKISGMEQEIARLTQANETLTQEKTVLIADKEKLNQDLTATYAVKQELEKTVDIGSTLNAYNIAITPINVKGSGKEKVSTTAKRVDKLVVSFDVTNRIVKPGATDLYVLVIGPDGQPLTNGETGTFTTREEGDKSFTAKLPVELEPAKKKNVEFSFAPGNFQQGNYTIQIYQNGFLIGEGTQTLKKGGLFS